jgi:hypothetical protein
MKYENNDSYIGFEIEKSSEEFWLYLFKVAEELPKEYIEEGESRI